VDTLESQVAERPLNILPVREVEHMAIIITEVSITGGSKHRLITL